MARIYADDLQPPERTAAQMLAVLTRIVNRKVQALYDVSKGGTVDLGVLHDDTLAKTVDLVVKLAREERQGDGPDLSKLTDQQLLALQQQKRPNGPAE